MKYHPLCSFSYRVILKGSRLEREKKKMRGTAREAVVTPDRSVASERLSWLQGHRVEVTVADLVTPVFEAVYVDAYPLGRDSFFVFRQGDKRCLIRSTSVIAVRQLD